MKRANTELVQQSLVYVLFFSSSETCTALQDSSLVLTKFKPMSTRWRLAFLKIYSKANVYSCSRSVFCVYVKHCKQEIECIPDSHEEWWHRPTPNHSFVKTACEYQIGLPKSFSSETFLLGL